MSCLVTIIVRLFLSLVLILDRVSTHPIVVKKVMIKQLLNWKREKKRRERERERVG